MGRSTGLPDDIALCVGQRAVSQCLILHTRHPQPPALASFTALYIKLFERAAANRVDNALKFCRPV